MPSKFNVAEASEILERTPRVMAKQYSSDVGPWIEYLPILTDRNPSS